MGIKHEIHKTHQEIASETGEIMTSEAVTEYI